METNLNNTIEPQHDAKLPVSGSGLVEKGLAYWIFYEEGHTYYCENCIDKRVEEINTNKEFSDDIDYEGGDTCGYYQDWADEDYEVECCKCPAPLLSNVDDV